MLEVEEKQKISFLKEIQYPEAKQGPKKCSKEETEKTRLPLPNSSARNPHYA